MSIPQGTRFSGWECSVNGQFCSLTNTTDPSETYSWDNKDPFMKGGFKKFYPVTNQTGTCLSVAVYGKKNLLTAKAEKEAYELLKEAPKETRLMKTSFFLSAGDDSQIIQIAIQPYFHQGDLFDYVDPEKPPIDPALKQQFIRDILASLDYLRKQKIVHRDIKPENYLVGEENRLTLTDFGGFIPFSAKPLKPNEEEKTLKKCSLFTGTLWYMPPEMLKQIFDTQDLSYDEYFALYNRQDDWGGAMTIYFIEREGAFPPAYFLEDTRFTPGNARRQWDNLQKNAKQTGSQIFDLTKIPPKKQSTSIRAIHAVFNQEIELSRAFSKQEASSS